MDCGKKWLVDFSAGKSQLVSSDQSNNCGANMDRGSYIVSISQTASKKICALIGSIEFISHEVALYLCKSIIRSCME